MANTQIPAAIQTFISATNAADSDRFIQAFNADATLNDWGTVYDGTDRIARWNQTDNIGKQSQFELVDAADKGDNTWLVHLKVSGNGFNGTSPFEIQVVNDKIQSLKILPD